MVEVKHSVVWGIFLYEFNLDFETIKIPYQLTFERDLYFDKTNVILMNLFALEDNEKFSPKIRKTVCDCFHSFFEVNSNETVYFELDLTYKRNYLKFLKFLRWSECHPEYNFVSDIIDTEIVRYVKVYISKN